MAPGLPRPTYPPQGFLYSSCLLGQEVRTSQPDSSGLVQDKLRLIERAPTVCWVLNIRPVASLGERTVETTVFNA